MLLVVALRTSIATEGLERREMGVDGGRELRHRGDEERSWASERAPGWDALLPTSSRHHLTAPVAGKHTLQQRALERGEEKKKRITDKGKIWVHRGALISAGQRDG
ncbi:hypothetical protein ATANTOWER_014619 [Ataeniobius toweri]|uniref:Uncharacterized protein n=1 Tax=Ataeniobius toweri TaxID=208326 RepID=A0ABU7API4_9TELE|nr:hypothetical protein [Ataeniobius toweri]